jgi:hypothetical protein
MFCTVLKKKKGWGKLNWNNIIDDRFMQIIKYYSRCVNKKYLFSEEEKIHYSKLFVNKGAGIIFK